MQCMFKKLCFNDESAIICTFKETLSTLTFGCGFHSLSTGGVSRNPGITVMNLSTPDVSSMAKTDKNSLIPSLGYDEKHKVHVSLCLSFLVSVALSGSPISYIRPEH